MDYWCVWKKNQIYITSFVAFKQCLYKFPSTEFKKITLVHVPATDPVTDLEHVPVPGAAPDPVSAFAPVPNTIPETDTVSVSYPVSGCSLMWSPQFFIQYRSILFRN